MLTRTAAHYPNSGHTTDTLSVVAEDWYETFKSKVTDRAFIEAVTRARRNSRFFPTEKDIFNSLSVDPEMSCDVCDYNTNGKKCANLRNACFDANNCDSFMHKSSWVRK